MLDIVCTGYTVRDNFTNQLRATFLILEEAEKLEGFVCMIMKEFYEFVSPTFPGKERLEKREHWVLMNQIFNSVVSSVDRCLHDKGIARYMSSKSSPFWARRGDRTWVQQRWYSSGRVAWVADVALNLQHGYLGEQETPMTTGHYFLRGLQWVIVH